MSPQKSFVPSHQKRYPRDWESISEPSARGASAADCTGKSRHWWHEQARMAFRHWYEGKRLLPCRWHRKDPQYTYYEHGGYHDRQNHSKSLLWYRPGRPRSYRAATPD